MTEEYRGTPTRFVLQRYRPGIEVAGKDGQRLAELEDKAANDKISEDELAEMHRIIKDHTDGAFLEGPEFTTLGVTDPHTFYENVRFMMEETEATYQSGYFLEALSLRMLALDLMLRIYVVHKTGKPIEPYSTVDKLSFGQLVKRAKTHGLPRDLADDLWAFNKKRVDGIHHFLLGRTSYQAIGDAYREADGLFERILDAADLPPLEHPPSAR